jgi:hypothetical protein
MSRLPDEGPDLRLVEDLIFGGKEIILRRFESIDTLTRRTPDFKVLRDGILVAFCEVKSPRDDWLDQQIEAATSGQIVGRARPDPTFNRIARHIEKAASQFDAVNGDRTVPNILVFVNHADAAGPNDLLETVTGTFFAENGQRFATVRHISQGRLASVREIIDLYIWIDQKTSRTSYFFNKDPNRVTALCDLLQIDATKIDDPSSPPPGRRG